MTKTTAGHACPAVALIIITLQTGLTEPGGMPIVCHREHKCHYQELYPTVDYI